MKAKIIKEVVSSLFADYHQKNITIQTLITELCSYADKNIRYQKYWNLFRGELEKQFDADGGIRPLKKDNKQGEFVFSNVSDEAGICHEAGVCPKCGSDNLDFDGCGFLQPVDEGVTYSYTCIGCGHTGKEYYSLNFVEHTNTDGIPIN